MTKLTKSDGASPLTGGEKIIRIHLSYDGIANGTEQLALQADGTNIFDIVANDAGGSLSSKSFTINNLNNTPRVSGVEFNQKVLDDSTINPFSSIVLDDPDAQKGQQVHLATLTISITSNAQVGLAIVDPNLRPGIPLTIEGSPFSTMLKYTLGTPSTLRISTFTFEALTDIIRSGRYEPVENVLSPGEQATVTGSIEIVDEAGPGANGYVKQEVTLIVEGKNDLPVITNSGSVTTTNDETAANPFSALQISDADLEHATSSYAGYAATITLLEDKVNPEPTDVLGILSTNTGFSKVAEGTYRITGRSMESVQAAIQGLSYDPTDNRVLPGKSETTRFRLYISDGVGTVVDMTNKVISTSVNNPHTLISKSYTIDENSPKGTVVGTLYDTTDPSFADGIISDPDAGTGQSYTVTFTFGNSNNAFSVKRTRTVEGEILQLVVENPSAVDYESQSFFTIGISVTDKENPGLYNPSTLIMVSVRDLDDSLGGVVASVSKDALNAEVTAYPVPTSGELNVKISSSYRGKVRLTLSSLSGKSVQSVEFDQSTDVSENSLDVSQLPSGVYLLQIITEEGIATKRVIKE